MRRISGQTVYLLLVVGGCLGLISYLFLFSADERNQQANAAPSRWKLEEIPFDGAAAYQYLVALCKLGPRPSGSEAMAAQQKLLTEHFRQLGATVERQEFQVRHPLDGSAVSMANLIIHWHPDRKERILLAAHYDTRPFPDRDPALPRGTFVGANDGASGVGLLMELGRAMPDLEGRVGVDFVLFDGEELVYDERGQYFLGSEHFAREYAATPPPYRYRWGVLLDMVGDANLQIYWERNSISWRETQPLVRSIWNTAGELKVSEFVARPLHEIRDDHLPLRNTAKIPTCDVIDFDYPYWHTEGDTPDKCSALSLAKVGWVIRTWLEDEVK